MKLRKILACVVSVAMALSLMPAIGITASAADVTATRITEYGWDFDGGAATSEPYLVSWSNNRHPLASFRIDGFDKTATGAVARLSFNSVLNNGTGGATTGTIYSIDPAAIEAKTQSALSEAVANKVKLGTVYVGANGTVTTDNLDITDCVTSDGKIGIYLSNREEDGCYSYGISTLTNFQLEVETGTVTSVNICTVISDDETGDAAYIDQYPVGNLIAGSTYNYTGTTDPIIQGNEIYVFDEERSVLSTVVAEDGSSAINLVYKKYDSSNTFSGYEVEDEGAWCWFADPRSISYKNADGSIDISILGYIDVHGNIKATQTDYNTNTVEEVLIRSNIQPDDHNNPTFLVLPDERIIVFYSRHTDEKCFWYRVTKEKGDLTTLGEEKCLATSDATTYPSPFLMENDPEHIYLCWRGINWHPTIAKLDIPDEDGNTKFVYGPYQMVQSTGARPYAKYASNGVDKIYVTYTTGHPDNEQPNWVYFNAINIADMTLEDVSGNTLSTIADGPLGVNKTDYSQSYIVDTAPGDMRDWVWQAAIGEDGKPVIAMVRISGGKTSHDYYYVKWNGEAWTATFLANGGGSFHQSSGLEMCYSGGMAIDPDNTSIIYCSVPVEGVFGTVYEIIKYTMSEDGTEVIATEPITKNSLKNNVRPFVIPDSEGRDIRLIWMHGDYYDWIVSKDYTTQGYCTAVMAENPLPAKEAQTDDALVSEDYSSIGGAFVSTTETANLIEASVSGEFTVSADVYLEEDGQILDLGSVQLGVETRDTQYGAAETGNRRRVILTVNGMEYVTSNVYGTSDCWKTFDRGTGGNYGVSDYDGYVNLTLTYDGKYLTLYRDGLIDAKTEASALYVDDVKVGGFGGYAANVAVYERALSHDDVKALADAEYVVEEPSAEGSVEVTCSYVDIDGSELLPSKTITLNAGTDIYNFKPDSQIVTDEGIFALDEELSVLEGTDVTAVYYMTSKFVGENLITNGSFEDEDGNFSVEGWYSPSSGETIGSPYETNYFYAVGTDSVITEGKVSASSNEIPDGQWALGTRWNDGANGLCSIKRSVAVESGKTYYVSYKIKNKNDDADGGYIRTSLIANPATITGDTNAAEEANITNAGTVGREWKTVERIFTSTDDTDNVLFWFRWLGEGNNTGNGPYWYFDDFKLYEIQDVEVVNITFDGISEKSYGTVELGEEGDLPEDVAGYCIVSADGTERFVPEGTEEVSEGDIITTAPVNILTLSGAQVRYGGGLDEDGKISEGNGIRFVATVDRSSLTAAKIVEYGIEITAEGADKAVEIPAEKWQDEEETIFTVALTNLGIQNYNRGYTARAYIVVKYDSGEERKIYSSSETSRSIYQVAAGLLTSGEISDGYGVRQDGDMLYNVLNAYVNMVGIRLTYDYADTFSMNEDGNGAYSGTVLFDVSSEKKSDGVYSITVAPVTENVKYSAKIMSYWQEFVRINNNHSTVAENISDVVYNDDGSVTFTFTVPKKQ